MASARIERLVLYSGSSRIMLFLHSTPTRHKVCAELALKTEAMNKASKGLNALSCMLLQAKICCTYTRYPPGMKLALNWHCRTQSIPSPSWAPRIPKVPLMWLLGLQPVLVLSNASAVVMGICYGSAGNYASAGLARFIPSFFSCTFG